MSGSDQNSSSGWIPPTVEELHALLPQYEISAVLGRGGMGAVYKGCQTNLKRDVAIKILPESLGDEGEHIQFVERFEVEAQSMAKLDHPAILSVYDFGETSDGQLYIVMEFIDGMDIEAYLHHHGGKLVHEHAIAITAHVLDALHYAHDHGVIHRDIKPANVLINSEGHVKIADFGLAGRLTQAGDDEGQAVAGTSSTDVVLGTPDFIAPEALEMGTNPDGRADLYSVGVMFYQMLTGKLPRGQFELPSRLNPLLDPRFDAVVSKALQANPDNRYGSATEFRRELDGLLTKPVPKEAVTKSGKAPAAVTGRRVPMQSRLPYPRPKLAEPKKSKAPLVLGLVLGVIVVIGIAMVATNRSDSGEKIKVTEATTSLKPEPQFQPDAPPIPEPTPDPIPEPAPIPEPKPEPIPEPAPAPEPSPIPEPKPDPRAALAAIPGLKPRLDLYLKTRRAQVGELAGKYLGGIEARLGMAAKAGDLKSARAYEAEKTHVTDLQRALGEPLADRLAAVEQPVTLPELPAGTPEEVTTLRLTWTTERQKIRDDLDGKLSLSLQALAAELTQTRSLDHAEAIVAYQESLPIPSPSAVSEQQASSGDSALAGVTQYRPFINSLGMKFVPVPITGGPSDGQRVLFSIWETRVADYAAFVQANPVRERWLGNSDQGDDLPAVKIKWPDAVAFCEWLTTEERKEGKIGKALRYRLPTDHEWSCAVGIGKDEDAKQLPEVKHGKIADVFPWGRDWPPPKGAGNFGRIEGYKDNFAGRSPVGSFEPNAFGIYDLGGNVWEWCEDWYSSEQKARVIRSGAFQGGDRGDLLSSSRHPRSPQYVYAYVNGHFGFRCVLAARGND